MIRSQIVDYSTNLLVFRKHLQLSNDERVIKLLSPKKLPDTGFFGLAQRYLIDPMTGTRGIRENVMITAAVYFPDTERRRG
ncbi:MAG: hypothetical protein BZ151_10740, partial [Desulfobacca sp. 4484_104]